MKFEGLRFFKRKLALLLHKRDVALSSYLPERSDYNGQATHSNT